MPDSTFDFKPDSETENHCSDGVIFTGQQNRPRTSSPFSPSPLLSPILYSSIFSEVGVKSRVNIQLCLPILPRKQSQANLQPRAEAIQPLGCYFSGDGWIIPKDNFCVNGQLKSFYSEC